VGEGGGGAGTEPATVALVFRLNICVPPPPGGVGQPVSVYECVPAVAVIVFGNPAGATSAILVAPSVIETFAAFDGTLLRANDTDVPDTVVVTAGAVGGGGGSGVVPVTFAVVVRLNTFVPPPPGGVGQPVSAYVCVPTVVVIVFGNPAGGTSAIFVAPSVIETLTTFDGIPVSVNCTDVPDTVVVTTVPVASVPVASACTLAGWACVVGFAGEHAAPISAIPTTALPSASLVLELLRRVARDRRVIILQPQFPLEDVCVCPSL
jgi:hypothetical protein